jgi:HEAT repeat protein
METAKAIIAERVKVASLDLEKIAINSELPRSSRIAAIYALGFARAATVRKILSDEKDDVDIRAHAAEALGNLADRDAIMLLKDILSHNPSEALRESCQYALEELKVT